jgi:hypothetical protein
MRRGARAPARDPLMPGRLAIVGLGLAIALVAVSAVVLTSLRQPPAKSEVGVVVFVDSVTLTDVRGFAIRTAAGETIMFRVGQLENGAQFPPGHLGEHEATAMPIRVTYRDEAGEHVAIRLEDAPAASPS